MEPIWTAVGYVFIIAAALAIAGMMVMVLGCILLDLISPVLIKLGDWVREMQRPTRDD